MSNLLELPTAMIDQTVIRRTNERLTAETAKQTPYPQNTRNSVRDVFQFGFNTVAMIQGDRSFTRIPAFLQDLCAAALEPFRRAGRKDLPPAGDFTNCIISDYRQGYRLAAHIDEYAEQNGYGRPDFYFGKDIVGVVLTADEKGRLYFIESSSPHPPYDATRAMHAHEETGLAFLMTGRLRNKPFCHGVTEIENRRVSATFRTVHFR